MSEYQASGGTSRLFEVGKDEQLQIEVHPDSYSVLWSSELSDSELSMRLDALLPRSSRRVVVSARKQESHNIYDISGGGAKEILSKLHDALRSLDFVRIDFDDRVLTWECGDVNHQRPNEVGFLAERFDPSYLTALLTSTATGRVTEIAEEAIYSAADIVSRFPSETLYPDEAELGPLSR